MLTRNGSMLKHLLSDRLNGRKKGKLLLTIKAAFFRFACLLPTNLFKTQLSAEIQSRVNFKLLTLTHRQNSFTVILNMGYLTYSSILVTPKKFHLKPNIQKD